MNNKTLKIINYNYLKYNNRAINYGTCQISGASNKKDSDNNSLTKHFQFIYIYIYISYIYRIDTTLLEYATHTSRFRVQIREQCHNREEA